MASFMRRFAGLRRAAGMAAAVGLIAGASVLVTSSNASAAPDHRFHGHPGPGFRGPVGPGFHGPGWYGSGRGWYGNRVGWYRGYYPRIFPGYGYYGTPYVRYYYPQYVYPQYVMPTAVYVMPRPPVAAAPVQQREFTVYFDFDHYNLTREGRRVVDAAIAAAQAGGPARISVTGNTDLAGTGRYNLVLSRHRAETVRRYMIDHGVDAGEIGVDARGKSDPAVRTADGVREPRNRRVEIVVTPEGGPQRRPPVTSMMAPPPPYGRPMVPANATMAPPPPVGQPTNLINP